MKKIPAFAVLTLIFLSVFSGCRSSEEIDFVSETDTVPVYPVHQFLDSGKTADSVNPVESRQEDIQLFPTFRITEDAEMSSEDSIHDISPDIQSYQPTVTEESETFEETVTEEPEYIEIKAVSPQQERAGIVMLAVVCAVGILSFAYYFFIFRRKVTK